MRGVITGREVLTNVFLVWRLYGFGCLCRCAWACLSGQRTTFLEVALKPTGR